MSTAELERTAKTLVSKGKGILAADERPDTLTKRFDVLKIESTPESRRQYREMLFATPHVGQFISGVILHDETIHQKDSTGTPLASVLAKQGIVPGIKVDNGSKPLAGSPGETITEGLDGLRDRLKTYHQIGARFAKWRGVIRIGEALPSWPCMLANARALARYAALCQEQDLVPIVEPEVLMDGAHTIERCEEVTGNVLQATINALFEQHVILENMLLKPNMVLAGKDNKKQASAADVAKATLRCLRRHAPASIPGVVFLSGGQSPVEATVHLNEINQAGGPTPWALSFSFGRALQDEALQAWLNKAENVPAAQRAYAHRAKCVSAAALGKYTKTVEEEMAA